MVNVEDLLKMKLYKALAILLILIIIFQTKILISQYILIEINRNVIFKYTYNIIQQRLKRHKRTSVTSQLDII